MQALVQRLAEDAPLQREVSAAPQIVRAVNRPTQRAMIEDHAVNVLGIQRVVTALRALRLVFVAEAAAQVTHDDVCGVSDLKRKILERDAVAGRSLAGDGD